jgi:tetratricopeptide (TPR) repeat protein
LFFEVFREAAARLPAGLVRPGPAGDAGAIAAAQRALGVALPDEYASFLRSFDGADLFHESVVVAGVGPGAPLSLLDLNPHGADVELAFAETLAGDRFVFSARATSPQAAGGQPAVIRVRAGSEERVLAGAGFSSWLEATLAREQILYGPDGEFAPEVFEPDGEEIVPKVALRQAERALRRDPGSAEAHHDRGVALQRLDRVTDAAEAFQQAGLLDPGNPWPWFDLGRIVLDQDPRRALAAFRRAADAESGAPARMLAWATHAARIAGDDAAAGASRAEALARQPGLLEDLGRALAAAVDDQDPEAAIQAGWLVAAMDPRSAPMSVSASASVPAPGAESRPALVAAPTRLRLPVLGARAPAPKAKAPAISLPPPAARRPPPGRPRRPGRAAPRPAGASPRGSKR